MDDSITINIDIDKLRNDLIDYFGSASSFIPVATMNIIEVEKASPLKLIKIAQDNNFDLNKYCNKVKKM